MGLASAAQERRAGSRFGRIGGPLRTLLGQAVDLALPPLCPACREPVIGQALCADCWSKLNFITRPYCERLGTPFAYDPGPGILSMQAISEPSAYGRARAAVRYDDVARTLVHAFKYGDRLDLAPTLGRWMARAGHELLDDADAIVPVPLHWRRLWARRFNQSAMLAETIARECGRPVAYDALKRVKATVQQVGLTWAQRVENVQGAFRVPAAGKAAIAGRKLDLVDDMLTIGAAAEGCARALLRAGAASVDVLSFAQVVDGTSTPI